MNKIFYLLVASGIAIFIGTILMYNLESGAENSRMKTLLDALWWCIATVTTVGYGDVVPVTDLGRIVAIVYMFFGITLIAILLAVITNTFYKKRFEKEEHEKKEQETNYLKNLIINRLSNIENAQSQCIDAINEIRSIMEKSGKH
jgi:voltage-gated potassium channel Kch